jgi:hypothetical protein
LEINGSNVLAVQRMPNPHVGERKRIVFAGKVELHDVLITG